MLHYSPYNNLKSHIVMKMGGVITVGDIDDLIANMDTIEKCMRKQKRIPTNDEREFGLFGKSKIIHHCGICGSNVYSTYTYCPQCGQKFCM